MNDVPEEKLYYIYLDTKIKGALEQLLRYFQAQVFTQDACISILCKYYREIEKDFADSFVKYGINFTFIKKQSDINLIKGKTIFYLFNAQSNCRMVAFRDLTHIFVTHGESHKSASIKPIIKIYDYVITSGRMGIDRFLKAGTFSESDISREKVISLGDTFIGCNNFIFDATSKSLAYAPTWEGGVPEENYSSISLSNMQKILTFCIQKNIEKVYIQPHPNLGHRIKSKKEDLRIFSSVLTDNGVSVEFIGDQQELKRKFILFTKKEYKKEKNIIPVRHAITDISAMEVQFISQKIPCNVFIEENIFLELIIPKRLNAHYNNVRIQSTEKITEAPLILDCDIFNYIFSYPPGIDKNTPFKDRIHWLCNYTKVKKLSELKSLSNMY